MEDEGAFTAVPGFCSDCGSILPLLRDKGNVSCFTCKRIYTPEVFGDMEVKYTINFNSVEDCTNNLKKKKKSVKDEQPEGPIVERRCPSCGNDKMSYATLQLRSADEGQTVFYTCTRCKYKESENS